MADSSAAGRPPRSAKLRIGIQGRLTLAASTLVAVVLVGGAVVLVLALRHSLLSTLDDSARQRARDVATLVDTGNLPNTVPAAGGTELVQVIDRRGRVIAATPGGDALVPLLSGQALADVRHGGTRELSGARIGISDTLRVVGTGAGPATARKTVLVAVSSSEAARSLRVVTFVLLVVTPLLLAAFAVVCWLLVGAALRPVAELRRGAGQITEAGTGARLPVPPTRDEIAQLAQTLNRMLDRLAAGTVKQRAFVADAAHELRSPLTSIRTQLEVARAHPDVAAWPETTDGMLVDLDRLSRLVDDLLLLARLDDGDRPRRQQTADLEELAEAAARRPGRRVPVLFESSGGRLLVAAGDDAVVRILDNLLSNADRYAQSRVVLAVSRAGDLATLTITDDGPGIPESEQERVFERFARVDEARSHESGGSGLGLAIVRELVRRCGGSVALHDANPGVRAVVTVPLAAPGDQPDADEREQAGARGES